MRTSAPLVVIAGPNGAGKSTASGRILQETLGIQEFVNADTIARGLSGFHPENAAVAAGRLMLQRLDDLAEQQCGFAFETTLATRSFAPRIRTWKKMGYWFRLVYLWLPSADMAVARVAERVRSGGHHVPQDTIRRRYDRSLRNLFSLYLPLADRWELLDNTSMDSRPLIASGGHGLSTSIVGLETWNRLESEYGIA